jgi:hypothetical protein
MFGWLGACRGSERVPTRYGPDLGPHQPWHASFCARPTISFVRKQRLLRLLTDTLDVTEEYRVESESEMDKK